MKIEFVKVVKRYGSQTVLDNLSFTVEDKTFTALIGNNGCGKTTSVNTICNIVGSDNGKVLVDNVVVRPDKNWYKNNMGIVLGSSYYPESFKVEEYLRFVGKFQKVSKVELRQRIKGVLTLLEMEENGKTIRNLSSGNKMKVSIAAALLHNPETLLLDEPFVNLDITTSQRLVNLFVTFRGKKTLLITSHDLDTVANLCDEFLIMDQGKIVLRLHKDNFASTEALKEEIRDKLAKREDVQSLAWLN